MENQGSKKKLQKYCLRLYSIPLMMESSNYDASWTRNHDYSTKTKKITCNIAEKRVKLIRTFSNLAKKNINKNEAEWPLLLKSNIQIQPKKKNESDTSCRTTLLHNSNTTAIPNQKKKKLLIEAFGHQPTKGGQQEEEKKKENQPSN